MALGQRIRKITLASPICPSASTATPRRITTNQAIDSLGRVRSTIEAVNQLVQRSSHNHFTGHQRSATTDPTGRLHTNRFDPNSRPIGGTQAAGSRAARQDVTDYDESGYVIRQTDGLGHETRFFYDNRDRLVSTTEAYGTSLARTMTTLYDNVGETQQLDSRHVIAHGSTPKPVLTVAPRCVPAPSSEHHRW
jgi:uncharacterized protein RhaS with RHS repeats